MKRTDDGYELSTGLRLQARGAMLGPVSPEPWMGQPWPNEAERREIAEYMIGLWREWGGVARLASEGPPSKWEP